METEKKKKMEEEELARKKELEAKKAELLRKRSNLGFYNKQLQQLEE